MKLFTNLLCKVALSSMVLTAPAMITSHSDAGGSLPDKEADMPFYSSMVIKNFIDHLTVRPILAYHKVNAESVAASVTYIIKKTVAMPVVGTVAAATATATVSATATVTNSARMVMGAAAKSLELRRVINESALIYSHMDLEKEGLSEKAFEYAWRGYHNLVKKGSIRNTSVLSICDFSQSSCSRRMYVLDLQHQKLLYRTYVAHGQNSGSEYAESFSNEAESFKSSLGFYVTQKTYYGRNGLSLHLNGVDKGYNDQALKRNIVLHGSTYVGDQYLQYFGTVGTSLGCPAIPSAISGRIIRKVRDGSCFFIYHPTSEYLDHSMVINNY
jgi:L,D-transpeptidase catalytic domain